MEQRQRFPEIVNVTDLRYRWREVSEKLEESGEPILVVEYSTPKAILLPFVGRRKLAPRADPLASWRRKYASKLAGWDVVAAVRKVRDSRWNLS